MREILHLQVGQFGNTIGTKFLENVACEHGICASGFHTRAEGRLEGEEIEREHNSQLEMHEVYFEEVNNRYIPRAVLVDFDPTYIDNARASRYGPLFRPDHCISGKAGTGKKSEAMNIC